MKGWKSYLLFEGIPFLLLFFVFGSLLIINWDYESKLISLDSTATDWQGAHLGPILLISAIGLAAVATAVLFFTRLSLDKSDGAWPKIWALIVSSIIFIFPSLFLIVLAPAAITMIEQMRSVPNHSSGR